jgi:hypothetical protein
MAYALAERGYGIFSVCKTTNKCMSQQYLHFSIHISSSKVPCTYVYVQHPQEFIRNIVEFRELSFVIKHKAVLLVQSESRFQTIHMNVVVEWLTLLRRIQEAPGLNLSPKTGFLTEVFRGFPQFLQVNSGLVP